MTVPSSRFTFHSTASPTLRVDGTGEASLGIGLPECSVSLRARSYRSRSGGTGNGAIPFVVVCVGQAVFVGVDVAVTAMVGMTVLASGALVGVVESRQAVAKKRTDTNANIARKADVWKAVCCCFISCGLRTVAATR